MVWRALSHGNVVGSLQVGEQRTVSIDALSVEAHALWRELEPGSVIWLSGELGAGKTTFVQALAEAAGATEARSPTFSLVHEYECSEGMIFHADCYRLSSPEDAIDLDFPEMLRHSRLLLIEWPDRAGYLAPQADLSLVFSHSDDPSLRIVERVL